MSAATLVPEPPVAPAKAGFWQRRLVRPVLGQLTQGVSPDKLAATFAIGTGCSLLPFLGFTTALNIGAGIALRMNQPILQTLNVLLGPVQLALILVYVRVGEAIWRATDDRFTVTEMIRTFHDASAGDFLQRFGWAGIHALTAWLLTTPILAAAIYFSVRPALRRAAKRQPA